MAKSDIEVEFTADFEAIKKGEVRGFSKDICNIFVNELKIAKFKKVKKEVKQKEEK